MGWTSAETSDERSLIVPERTILLKTTPDGFGTYHDLIKSSGATTAERGDAFEATLTAYRSPQMMLFDRQVVGAEHLRGADQAGRDGYEHFYVQVLRSGRLACGPLDRECWLSPGDAMLFDATLPQRALAVAADYVTMTLPRSLVEAYVPNARLLHGRILPRSTARDVGEAVLALSRSASGLVMGEAAGANRMIAGMLARSAGQIHESSYKEFNADLETSRRLRASLFIETNLMRQNLDVGAVARGTGLSRSSLYRVFGPIGGVEREITRRRVARLRAALLKPEETRSIETLAHSLGFASLSHGSRHFKNMYGLAPNQLRAELRAIQSTKTNALDHEVVSRWYDYLNA